MPAHRSEAEAAIRRDVIAKLREILPGARANGTARPKANRLEATNDEKEETK